MAEVSKFNPKIQRRLEIIEILIALFIIGFSIFSLLSYNTLKSGIEQSIQTTGLIGLFLIVIFLEFIPQVISPIFGVWAAILSGINVHAVIFSSIIASLIGSASGFWFGRLYGPKLVPLILSPSTLAQTKNLWEKYGKFYVFFSAITIFPYAPMVFGAANMSWKEFTLLGLIPRIFKFIILGYAFYFGFSFLA